jgi:hypothetical protein
MGVAAEMKVGTSAEQVSISFDEDPRCPMGREMLQSQIPATPCRDDSSSVRVLAEVYRAHGGMRTRAMLGGVFRRSSLKVLELTTLFNAEPIALGRPADCHSPLGPPLVCGLPADLARSAHRDLLAALQEAGIPSGSMIADQAAHDPLDSSENSFRLVGSLVAVATKARLTGRDPERAVTDLMSTW